MAAEFRKPLLCDLAELVRHARPIDRVEWEAMTGDPMTVAGLRGLVRQSRNAHAVLWEGRLVAVCGVQCKSVLADTGAIWLLATSALADRAVRREMARHSRAGLLGVAEGFRAVWNAVAVENTLAIRWLKWLGFTFDCHSQCKVRGVEFIPFYKEFG